MTRGNVTLVATRERRAYLEHENKTSTRVRGPFFLWGNMPPFRSPSFSFFLVSVYVAAIRVATLLSWVSPFDRIPIGNSPNLRTKRMDACRELGAENSRQGL